jgi:protease-4
MAFLHVIGAFLKGLWHALDGLRKVLHLVLLLVLFGILFAATRSSLPFIPGSAALVLSPQGMIVEELSGDPLERALLESAGEGRPETRRQDLIDVIAAAAEDERIKALVLDLGGLQGAGLPTLESIGVAIDTFRESGKPVLAWGGYYDQRQYYLAARADEVYLDPYGTVIIEGYGYFRQYLKGAADKLGVDVHLFKVGTHKTAPETFTRKDMSPEDREEARVWLAALWDGWKTAVGAARDVAPERLQAYADGAAEGVAAVGGDLAQYALGSGLVDGLRTWEQFEERVAEDSGTDTDEHSFRSVDWRSYLTVVRSEAALHRTPDHNVGVIVASGDILDGEQPRGTVGGDTLAGLLREARYDDTIDAVVLRIDSPGGSMFAAEQIRREVDALREAGKPVVASMADIAASGGYLIAAPADRILAAPTTITGSIGVYMVFPTLETTLAKIGITSDGIGTTDLSGAGRIDRDLNPELASILQSSVEHAYRQFISQVAQYRQRPFDEIDSIGQGKVWSGADAKAAGLIDDFGDMDEAIDEAARLGSLPEDHGVVWIEPSLTWREMLALRIRSAAAGAFGWLGLELSLPSIPLMERIAPELRRLAAMTHAGRPLYWCPCRVD